MLSSAVPAWRALAEASAAWLLTYVIHSTLLLGAAWLASSRLIRSNVLRDLLWKAALVGGLITATAQVSGVIVARWELRPNPIALFWQADAATMPVIEDYFILQRGSSNAAARRAG
jgi:hypothetical protein